MTSSECGAKCSEYGVRCAKYSARCAGYSVSCAECAKYATNSSGSCASITWMTNTSIIYMLFLFYKQVKLNLTKREISTTSSTIIIHQRKYK